MEDIGYVKLENEAYNVDKHSEVATLNGVYSMKAYLNPHQDLKYVSDNYCNTGGPKHLHAKSPFIMGHILYKTDEPDIEDHIDLLIKATYEELPSFVDTSVKEKKQMIGGTICPTREIIFRYKGKLFIVYGRYIYGYDAPYVQFFNKNQPVQEYDDDSEYEDINDDEDIDDDYKRKDAKLTRDEIILPTVPYDIDIPEKDFLDDYNYSFKITDEASGNLDVFAIYR